MFLVMLRVSKHEVSKQLHFNDVSFRMSRRRSLIELSTVAAERPRRSVGAQ